MTDWNQFETIALLRAYSEEFLKHSVSDLRPSTAKYLSELVSRMHNIKDKLVTR